MGIITQPPLQLGDVLDFLLSQALEAQHCRAGAIERAAEEHCRETAG
jgi:hypothetical protein